MPDADGTARRPNPGPIWSDEAAAAVREQAEATPESQGWLALLAVALEAADREVWRETGIRLAGRRPTDAPLLEGARISVPTTGVAPLMAELLERGGVATPAAEALDPVALVDAAVRLDDAVTGGMAARVGVPHGVLATVGQLLALPLLVEAHRRAAPAIPPDWVEGYCPVCAAWPTLAEVRGLDRTRVLRCGRCASEWGRDVLHCAFCGERDHRRQGSLVPETEGEWVRIETCTSCHGYLKVLTTLRPRPAWSLPLDDLRTLPLELLALERGFARPARPGWRLSIELAPRVDVPAGGGDA